MSTDLSPTTPSSTPRPTSPEAALPRLRKAWVQPADAAVAESPTGRWISPVWKSYSKTSP